jgi:hypothetical protein
LDFTPSAWEHWWLRDPWAMPTANESHACCVNEPVANAAGSDFISTAIQFRFQRDDAHDERYT